MQSDALKKIPGNFCPAPFQSFVQDYHGNCGPCPYQAGVWNFKDVPISERWNHPAVEMLRQEHLSGIRSPVCQRCYTEEDAGFRSRRIAENEWKPLAYENLRSGKAKAGLETMVFRISNNCNYACRSCHSVDSSLFRKEGQYYLETYGDFTNRYVERQARIEFSAEQMLDLSKLTADLKELQFYGGEPMLNKTHYVLLQHLIDQGRAGEVALFYCTNASIYPSEAQIALWKQFRAVHLHFSLDAIGEQYHFVRWPGKWEKVSANIHRWQKELAPQFEGRLTFGSNTTVSSMNVYDIPEIYSCLEKLFGDRAAITTVHDPSYFSVVHLPTAVKKKISAKLQNSEHAAQFAGIVAFMNEREFDPNIFRDFVHWTEKMDEYRKVKFAKYFPEYYSALKPYYKKHAKTAFSQKRTWAKELRAKAQKKRENFSSTALGLLDSAKKIDFSFSAMGLLRSLKEVSITSPLSGLLETAKNKARRMARKPWRCSYAWEQIIVDSRGRVKPCGRFRAGEKFGLKISDAPLESIINSADFREIRRQMNLGEIPEGCQKCRAEEAAGIPSMRQKANRKSARRLKNNPKISAGSISSIEFFLGHDCNLKCRTCDHWNSSSIYLEEKNLGILHEPRAPTNLALVEKLAKSLRTVKIAGGEPFLIDRHLELLKLLAEKGSPSEISLSYNTNATIFPSAEVLALWRQFAKVTVALSVDGVGKLNDYIRSSSEWATVDRVARQFVALASERENIHLNALCTVSAYNLHAIADVMRWWEGIIAGLPRLASSPVSLNFVRDPAHLAADVLPAPLKSSACEALESRSPEMAKRVRSFVTARDASDLLPQFMARTRQLDRVRGQSVAEAIPELRSLFASQE